MTKAKSAAGKKKEVQTQLNKRNEHRRGQCLPALLVWRLALLTRQQEL